jgi:hypothetical protein
MLRAHGNCWLQARDIAIEVKYQDGYVDSTIIAEVIHASLDSVQPLHANLNRLSILFAEIGGSAGVQANDAEGAVAVVALAAADMGGEGRDRHSLRLHQAFSPSALIIPNRHVCVRNRLGLDNHKLRSVDV